MAHVLVKVNAANCRAVICTEIPVTFCGPIAVNKLGLKVIPGGEMPMASASDGTPIEFLGSVRVNLELGPYKGEWFQLYVSTDCPSDILIGNDFIEQISKTHTISFNWPKKAVIIGGTRISMLDPNNEERIHISTVILDRDSRIEVVTSECSQTGQQKTVNNDEAYKFGDGEMRLEAEENIEDIQENNNDDAKPQETLNGVNNSGINFMEEQLSIKTEDEGHEKAESDIEPFQNEFDEEAIEMQTG